MARIEPGAAAPAAFLDRDGVINFDAGYVHDWSEFRFLPGVVDALCQLQALGYRLIVITNQSGIARGMYTESAYQALTVRLKEALREQGVTLAQIYHCPHHPDGGIPQYRLNCECRKPRIGMIKQALRDFDIDMAASILVGDKPSDIEAGVAAGVGRRFLVRCNGEGDRPALGGADGIFDDLAQCVARLSEETRERASD
ncbi:MAG: hypothetical protein RJA63_2026 [Pseudomonadota bacterium]|jgi:D-glycero-D-manno-heptose 1,7-bisphosphate phosphatase